LSGGAEIMLRIEELREQLASYIANEIPFAVFEDWLIDQSWDMHKDSPVDAQELVHSINVSIFKYLDQYISEAALKREMLALIKDQTVYVFIGELQSTIRQSWGSQVPVHSAQVSV
jgi:hypothetical protein